MSNSASADPFRSVTLAHKNPYVLRIVDAFERMLSRRDVKIGSLPAG